MRESTWRLEAGSGVVMLACSQIWVTFIAVVPSKLEHPK